MDDRDKSKDQLIRELSELRQRHASSVRAEADQAGELHDSNAALEFAESVIQTVREPLLVLDAEMRILSANHSFFVTFGLSPGDTIGRCIFEIDDRQWDIPRLRMLLEGALAQDSPFEDFEVTHEFRTVGLRIMLLNARRVQADHTEAQRILLAIEDVTVRRQLEERLFSASVTDDLTGLYNRRGFFIMAERLLAKAVSRGEGACLVFVDLDGLKRINDRLGHEEGDQALIDTARLLRDTFRESDVATRIGGDEFVVMLMNPLDSCPEAIRARLLEAVESHNLEPGRGYKISLSVGVAAQTPASGLSLRQLLGQADQEMYEQKRRKRGHH